MKNKWRLTMAVAGMLGLALLVRPAHVGATTPVIGGTPVFGSCNTFDGTYPATGTGCYITFYNPPGSSWNKCLYIYDLSISDNGSTGETVTVIANKAEGYGRNVFTYNLVQGGIFDQDFQSPIIVGSSHKQYFIWDGRLDITATYTTQPTSFVITGIIGTCPDAYDPGYQCH